MAFSLAPVLDPIFKQTAGRIAYIERAKGLGITLVVFGHISGRSVAEGNEWYRHVYWLIYFFHMPFFMFLSGLVFGLSNGIEKARQNYPRFLTSRAKRLLIPFFGMGLIALLAKTFGQALFKVQAAPSSLFSGLVDLFITTGDSPAIFIWYIAVLFCFLAIFPALYDNVNKYVIIAVALCVYFIPVPKIFYLDKAFPVFIFFVSGVFAGLNLDRFEALLPKTPLIFAAFLALLLFMEFAPDTPFDMLVAGALSVPALLYLVRSGPLSTSVTLSVLGTYSFIIYLLNTAFAGVVRSVGQSVLPFSGTNFLIYIPFLMLSGLVGPILVKVLLLRLSPTLDRLTD